MKFLSKTLSTAILLSICAQHQVANAGIGDVIADFKVQKHELIESLRNGDIDLNDFNANLDILKVELKQQLDAEIQLKQEAINNEEDDIDDEDVNEDKVENEELEEFLADVDEVVADFQEESAEIQEDIAKILEEVIADIEKLQLELANERIDEVEFAEELQEIQDEYIEDIAEINEDIQEEQDEALDELAEIVADIQEDVDEGLIDQADVDNTIDIAEIAIQEEVNLLTDLVAATELQVAELLANAEDVANVDLDEDENDALEDKLNNKIEKLEKKLDRIQNKIDKLKGKLAALAE